MAACRGTVRRWSAAGRVPARRCSASSSWRAVPTLVKRLPTPLRRLIGDLSDEDRVMIGLDIVPKSRNGRG